MLHLTIRITAIWIDQDLNQRSPLKTDALRFIFKFIWWLQSPVVGDDPHLRLEMWTLKQKPCFHWRARTQKQVQACKENKPWNKHTRTSSGTNFPLKEANGKKVKLNSNNFKFEVYDCRLQSNSQFVSKISLTIFITIVEAIFPTLQIVFFCPCSPCNPSHK